MARVISARCGRRTASTSSSARIQPQVSIRSIDSGVVTAGGPGTSTLRSTARRHVVPYKIAGDTFVAERPRSFSPQGHLDTDLFRRLDVSPDGKRFVVAPLPDARTLERSQSRLVVPVNFFDEVRRRILSGGCPRPVSSLPSAREIRRRWRPLDKGREREREPENGGICGHDTCS
jgi:hypothetical protein